MATFGCCAACYITAGPTFDFFMGCLLFASLICPTLATASERSVGAWIVPLSIWIVMIGWWLVIGHIAGVTTIQWMWISLILAGTLGIMVVATRLLMRWRIAPVFAAAIVTTLQMLWLTWPIWLSPSIAGAKLNWSVSLHPLLAMNGVLKDLGIWTEQPIAYNLTTLGQDVQYELPTVAWPVVTAQLIVIVLLLLAGRDLKSEISEISNISNLKCPR